VHRFITILTPVLPPLAGSFPLHTTKRAGKPSISGSGRCGGNCKLKEKLHATSSLFAEPPRRASCLPSL
jgi:hypothetical protein